VRIADADETGVAAPGHQRDDERARLRFDSASHPRLTHYLFRYPAKFHPPVVRALINRYTEPGDRILDPFCGSGTLLVEASVAGRHSIGSDVDPVATFVSRSKTARYGLVSLKKTSDRLLHRLAKRERSEKEYLSRRFDDLSDEYTRRLIQREGLPVPSIPKLFHWFRRYVVVDLARILQAIKNLRAAPAEVDFLLLCLASAIRNASNADPVPVSGLEVTAHMKRLDAAGRLVNPFRLFEGTVTKALRSVEEYALARTPTATVSVFQADATQQSDFNRLGKLDGIITSPPYHIAVDYYRRHQLEMYWLGLTQDHVERLALLPRYIGRATVPRGSGLLATSSATLPGAVTAWEAEIRQQSERRANAFRHYALSMQATFAALVGLLKPGGKAIFVVGHSTWNGKELPTAGLFAELAGNRFRLRETLWYPIANRYMSYARRNGAGIETEYVLVFEAQQNA